MNKNYDRLTELFEEFSQYVESLHTLYLDSVIGYEFIHERLIRRQSEIAESIKQKGFSKQESMDNLAMSYQWLVGRDVVPVSFYPVMKQGEIKKRTMRNGYNYERLGSQCIVEAYAYWEEYLRREIGFALGVIDSTCSNSREILNRTVTSNFWGDVRYLRNSILHNKGKANSDMRNCKVMRWFKPGEEIQLDYEKMEFIFTQLGEYRFEIQNMSYPPNT